MTSHRVHFIHLTEADIAPVLELERACFSMPWSEAQFRGAFQQKNFAVFALRDSGLVAYVSFYHAARELEILNIAVTPARRRQGLGRRLLDMALQVAQKMDIHRAVLEVRVGNIPARSLYEGLGFVQVGLRSAYYGDTDEDALIYAREF